MKYGDKFVLHLGGDPLQLGVAREHHGEASTGN